MGFEGSVLMQVEVEGVAVEVGAAVAPVPGRHWAHRSSSKGAGVEHVAQDVAFCYFLVWVLWGKAFEKWLSLVALSILKSCLSIFEHLNCTRYTKCSP